MLTVSIGIDGLELLVERVGIWGPLAIIALKMTTIIIVPLPVAPSMQSRSRVRFGRDWGSHLLVTCSGFRCVLFESFFWSENN